MFGKNSDTHVSGQTTCASHENTCAPGQDAYALIEDTCVSHEDTYMFGESTNGSGLYDKTQMCLAKTHIMRFA